MEKLTDKLCSWLISNNIISEEDRPIYEYGVYQLLSSVLEYGVITVIALLMGMFGYFVFFMLTLMILRKNAGGVHSESHLTCFIVSTVMIAGVLSAVKWLFCNVLMYSVYILAAVSSVAILLLAPVETPSKPLDEKERMVFGRRTRLALLADVILTVIFYLLKLNKLSFLAAVSIVLSAVLVVLGQLKNRYVGGKCCRNSYK